MYQQSMFEQKTRKMSHFSSEKSSIYSREKFQHIAWACYCNDMQKAAIAWINEGLDEVPKITNR